ncbi:phage tail protein I [Arvimicrobium flavum]|uniref:phage tail protein I n=1 Tax=Arvimicrobium flavum TaxID=3393320 RepID=UPI00237A712D|nr:phage tail protein I [Mesorhizobium shangrilense]
MADDLLPSSASPFLKSLSVSQARILDVDMDVIRRSVLAHISPASLLPWLAWDRSVDEYVDSWPEEVKRAVIGGSFPYHKIKGTPGALKAALASLGFETTVTEWFEYGGEPYRFRVKVVKHDGASLTQTEYQALRRLIMSAKNVRSMLDALETAVTQRAPAPYVAAWGARRTRNVTLYPEAA